MRLLIVVEGQTEAAFVSRVLAPHLLTHGVYASATIAGTPKRRGSSPLQKGGGDWPHWERDIRRLLGEQPQAGVRVTTLFDLYGLPAGFPGLQAHRGDGDTNRRCENLEAAMAGAFADRRFIPYLQRHEFEALVLASLPSLRSFLDAPDDLAGLDALTQEIGGLTPEDVDDGPGTAPSKRLQMRIGAFVKTVHGVLAVEDAGLAAIRARCRRFDIWIDCLEGLGQAAT